MNLKIRINIDTERIREKNTTNPEREIGSTILNEFISNTEGR